MSARRATKLAKCVNAVTECVKDPRIWNQAGWEAVLEDIDKGIEYRRLQIRVLMRSRRIVQRNLENFTAYPWDDSVFDAMPDAKSQAIHQNNMRVMRERRGAAK